VKRGTLLLGCWVALACDNHLGQHGVTQPVTTPAPSLVQLASDNFDRANENPIAGSWTSGPGVASDVQLLNNAAKVVGDPTVNGNGVAFWSAATFPANQWAEVTLPTVPTTDDIGPAVRIAATVATYYVAPSYPNGRLAIYRAIDHAFTQLFTTASGFVVAGDRVRLEVEGTTLRVFKNGVLVGQAVDDAITTGAPGIVLDDMTGTLDDWAAGSLDSAPAPPPPSPSPPAAPTNLTAVPISANQIDLSWTDNDTIETGFRIERCAGAGCDTFGEIATVGANVVSYQHTGLAGSTSYSYRVRAYNAAGTSAYSNVATAVTPPSQAADRVPDLGMARLADIRIERTGSRRLLRYSTTIVNVGAGKFEVRGHRASTAEPTMSLVQRVYDDAGGWREVATTGAMIFGGDGHNHWHVRDLQQSELFRLTDDAYLTRSDKRGFCFWDNVKYRLSLPGAPQSQVYHESGCGRTDSLNTAMGLSIGWGDIYPSTLPDQFIDVTHVPDGHYRLVVTADPFGWFTETSNDNNFTWVSLELWDGGRRVRVLDYGPNALVAASLTTAWKRTWPAPRARSSDTSR
jgi:hypothetical protein